MASEVADALQEKMVGTCFNQAVLDSVGSTCNPPSNLYRTQSKDGKESEVDSSSSYTLASDGILSEQLNNWLQAPIINTANTGVQHNRAPLGQRPTLASTSSIDPTGMWYLLAMILPLFSLNNAMQWRCTPNALLSAAELFVTQLAGLCRQIRLHLRRLAEDQLTRDLFASLMDIVLVIYAIGFLILSLYQAAVIG